MAKLQLTGKDPWEFGMTSRLRPLEDLFLDTEQGGIRESHYSGV
jgi:hypothetical protein